MPRCYIIACEASGDALGADLVRIFNANGFEIAGVGGERMRASGLKSLFDISEVALMGWTSVLLKIPRLLYLIGHTVDDIVAFHPDVVITIDSSGFNFRVIKRLKERLQNTQGMPLLMHYVAPMVWAYKSDRGREVEELYDHLFTLLPFESECFSMDTTFVGHKLSAEHKLRVPYSQTPEYKHEREKNRAHIMSKYGISLADKIVLLLPGSRKQELDRHLELFVEACGESELRGSKLFLLTTKLCRKHIKQDDRFIVIEERSEKDMLYTIADFAIVKSGTVSLEIASYNIPMVVVYNTSWLNFRYISKCAKVKYASLINILQDKEVIPEYLQCSKKELVNGINKALTSDRVALLRDYSDALRQMDAGEPPEKIVFNVITRMLNSKKPN